MPGWAETACPAGDGAGILVQIPHEFLKEQCAGLKIRLPKPGHYACGHLFMPQDERLRAHCERVWARIIREEGLEFLGWRSVPVDNSCLSDMVKATEPQHRQLFIGRPKWMKDQDEFERKLYLIRKVVSNAIYDAYKGRDIGHYTVCLSSRTLVYKGMMFSDVPNLAFAVGYTNASWTLKCDLTAEYVCRLLNHMDHHGYSFCMPRVNDPDVEEEPVIDFNSGYVLRALDSLPRQGSKPPWRLHQCYVKDLSMMRYGRVEDGTMEFKTIAQHARAEAAGRG